VDHLDEHVVASCRSGHLRVRWSCVTFDGTAEL
jgi:hypothetical protein